MGARAEKNPTVSHYPDISTPMQVTEAGPDPRPGYTDDGPLSNGGPVPDPSGLLTKFSKIGAKYPKGDKAMHDKSLAHKGKR